MNIILMVHTACFTFKNVTEIWLDCRAEITDWSSIFWADCFVLNRSPQITWSTSDVNWKITYSVKWIRFRLEFCFSHSFSIFIVICFVHNPIDWPADNVCDYRRLINSLVFHKGQECLHLLGHTESPLQRPLICTQCRLHAVAPLSLVVCRVGPDATDPRHMA